MNYKRLFTPYFFLFCTELFHLCSHLLVLTQLYSISHLGRLHRLVYFTFDLLSNLASYTLTKRYRIWILIHSVIHCFAILHLYVEYSIFWQHVYEMSENNENSFINKDRLTIILYIIGTLFDIITHGLNVNALSRNLISSYIIEK